MFKNYLTIALRNIKKHKTYSFINISGLAIGIAACSLILLWVQDELTYDHYHKNLEDISKAVLNVEGQYWNSSNWALAPILKQDYPEIEKATRYASRTRLMKYEQNRFYEMGAFVDEDFLEIFTYPLLEGNPKTALATHNSIILTRELATKYFASENPMGKVLTMDNNTELTVTGIIKNVPSNSTFQFGFLAPVNLFGEERLNSWAVESQSYYLLKENTNLEDLNKKISGVVMKHDTRTKQDVNLFLHPYKLLHLYSLSGTGTILYVYLFSTIAFLILLNACINFMNLATAKANNRAREIGIRKVVGADKMNVIRQFFSESIILSFVALIFAIVLVYLFLPAFNSLAGKQLSLNILGSFSHIGGLIVITLLTGLISGSYPSLVLSSFKPVEVLKISNNAGSTKSLLRRFLVVSQFCAAIVLIISTLVIYKQLDYIRSKNLGFNREHVVIFPLYDSFKQNYESFKNELKQNRDIINVTTASSIPTRIGNINPVYWEGQTSENYRTINFVAVDYDYFDTFEMTMADGRKFFKEFSTDKQNYIVNEELAKLMDFESVIGKMFSIWQNEGQIIGVVKNFHSRSLHSEIAPVVFTCSPDWYWCLSRVFVKINSEKIPETLEYIEKTVAKFAPEYPFTYSFLDEHFEKLYRGDQQIGTIFKYFSIIAIFISCLGLFGLAAFMVGQRTKEIGIRRVLGASKSYIMMILSKEFIVLIVVSNIIAWPLAYLVMNILMESYAYRTDISILIFIGAGFFTLLMTFLTISVQTLKATRANPVDALRYE
jgi:ABC-type antimicrobial peptide transport system permease subunit